MNKTIVYCCKGGCPAVNEKNFGIIIKGGCWSKTRKGMERKLLHCGMEKAEITKVIITEFKANNYYQEVKDGS